ncbi:MAG: DUF2125 domain-containing protein [Pseudomonadota bacterium]
MAEGKSVSRRWLYIAWIGAALIVAAYFALWRHAAGEMETAASAWVDEQRASGLFVAHDGFRRDGFPFVLRLHVDNPQIATPDGWRWSAPRLSMDALPYDFNRVIFSSRGAQTIRAPDGETWSLSAGDLRASLANDKEREWILSAQIENARVTNVAAAPIELGSLLFDIAPSADEPDAFTLSLAARDLATKTEYGAIDGDSLNAAFTLTSASALGAFDPLPSWRSAGGRLRIHGIEALVNEAGVTVVGDLGLSADLFPEGDARVSLSKPAGIAPLLAATGALSADEANAAAAGLGFAALAQGGVLVAPIVFEEDAIKIAGVRLSIDARPAVEAE